MRQMTLAFIMVWISSGLLSGCASSKNQIFGEDMPTMKAIHDEKFLNSTIEQAKPSRSISQSKESLNGDTEFQWLPNPILTMYVFKHLSPAGYPVPGYSTFFRLYDRDQLATPSELGGWEE